MASDNVVVLTDVDFEEKVLQADKPVLVDFWAPWCNPCIRMAPTVEQLGEAFKGKAIVAKMNVDENPKTPAAYGIRSIPTFKVFKAGGVVDETIGTTNIEKLSDMLQKAL